MDTLFRKHDRLIAITSTEIVREMMQKIHWDSRLISIIGSKGVGKSTLIKQYIKMNYAQGDRRVLYCSADTVDFSTRTLVGLAEEFVLRGGELLIIDEPAIRLDASQWETVDQLLHQAAERGAAVLAVTANPTSNIEL